MGRRDTVTASVERTARKAAADKVEEILHPDENGEEPEPSEATKADRSQLDKLLQKVSAASGLYAKLYRREATPEGGHLAYLCNISPLTADTDLEVEISRLAKEHHWGPGMFHIKVYKRGSGKGMECPPVEIAIGVEPTATASGTASPVQHEGLAQVKAASELVNSVRGMLGPQAPQADPAAISNAILAAMKMGLELAPKPQPLTEILSTLKELGIIKPEPNWREMMEEFREEKEPAGGLLDDEAKLERWLNVAERLLGRRGHKTSETAEIIGVAGPYIRDAVKDITGTIREGFAIRRQQMSVLPPAARPAEPPQSPPPTAPPTAPTLSEFFINDLKSMMVRNDPKDFPRLFSGFAYVLEGGSVALNQLRMQAVTIPDVLAWLATLDESFKTPEAVTFFTTAMQWYATQPPLPKAPPEAPPGPIIEMSENDQDGPVKAVCETCDEGYSYDDLEHYNQDSKVCDAKDDSGVLCRGPIKLVTPVGTS